MPLILGIDPSLRHTGLCLKDGNNLTFHEIKTKSLDVLSASELIREEFFKFVEETGCSNCSVSMEKQLSVGASYSSLMFHVQMNMLQAIKLQWVKPFNLIMPLPVHLLSYLKRVYGLKPSREASPVVKLFKETTLYQDRVSVHCVDAYYLAEIGEKIIRGEHSYNKPKKEKNLTPWRILDGTE
jgi:hypothetical protein